MGANPFLSGGQTGTRPSGNPFLPKGATPTRSAAPTTAPAPAAPAHHGGGFFDEVGGALRGIGVGTANLLESEGKALANTAEHPWISRAQGEKMWKHPLAATGNDKYLAPVANAYVQGEKKIWGPVFQHGDFSGVENDPVGAGADVLTLATGGLGGIAKLGKLAEATNLIAKDSRLARLGEPVALTVPDLAKQLGQEGSDVTRKISSTSPLTKARQVGVNKTLNALNPKIPIVGSEARLARTVAKAGTAGQALALKAAPLEHAFSRLNKTEQAVWHLRMQHLDPEGYQRLLAEGAVADPAGTEALMTSKLQGAKLNALYRNPASSKRLMVALQVGHDTADLLTAAKVSGGFLDPLAAEERNYLAQRVTHGATVVGGDAAKQAQKDLAQHIAGIHSGLESDTTALEATLNHHMQEAAAAARRADEKTVGAGLRHGFAAQGSVMQGITAEDMARMEKMPLGARRAYYSKLQTSRAAFHNGQVAETLRKIAATHDLAHQRIAEAQAAALPQGIHDLAGHGVPEIIQRLDEENAHLPDNLRQPSYVPHSAETAPRRSWQTYRPGANPPMKPGSARQNEAVLLSKGMLNLHKNSLAEELRDHARIVQRTDTHEALMHVAAKLPETGLPPGFRFLKTRTGEASAPYTERAAGGVKQELAEKPSLRDRVRGGTLSEQFTTSEKDLPDEAYAKDAEGHRLIIPDHVANLLSLEARPSKSLLHSLLYNKPTTVWKHLILGLRPAYMVNIIASQHILGALQMAGGGRGVAAYFNHLLPGARLGKLTDSTIEDVMPEQAAASFSHSTGTVGARGVAAKAYQGVMPVTMKAENWLRRLMIEGWAKSSPEVVRAMRANGGDINAALRDVAKTDPHVLHEISRRVDDAQGNYRTYSPAEEKLRQVVPFYGWDRHIIQSTYRILSERPGLADAGYKIGQQGQQQNLALFGKLPPYLQGIIALGDLPHALGTIGTGTPGTTSPVFASKAIEPFSTVGDLVNLAGAAVSGQPGTGNDQLSNINPLLTSTYEALTGKSSLTGTPLKGHIPGGVVGNVAGRTILDLPQARLAEQILHWHPTGQSKTPVSSRDWLTQLLALMGAPVKKIDPAEANSLASRKPGT